MKQKKFFSERYVKEPYSREFKGIHYGEKDSRVEPLQSYMYMYARSMRGGNYNTSPNGVGIAMQPMLDDNMELVFYREIESDSFFMVGDNRDNSEDSRFWGVVDYSRIVGKPWFTYFSITLADSIESETDDPFNLYKIRWTRMFKTIETLQSNATAYDGECRYYEDLSCKSPSVFYKIGSH